jgi:hypothetical protein
MAVRLAVSIHALRRFYRGPITILSEGDDSHAFTYPIAERFDCNVQNTIFNGTEGKNTTYLNACLVGDHTPYETTIWLDSDTLPQRPFTELFDAAERFEFAIAQFATWKTHGKRIGKRIEAWRGILPDHWLKRAFDFGPAINCGVFAFHQRSALIRDWHGLALQGQKTFIPDEVCCQIMLAQPEYPNKIMPQEFNCSTKYADPTADNVRIIHHHGSKHARFHDGKPQYDSQVWWEIFDEIRDFSVVQDYIRTDPKVRRDIGKWDKWKRKA